MRKSKQSTTRSARKRRSVTGSTGTGSEAAIVTGSTSMAADDESDHVVLNTDKALDAMNAVIGAATAATEVAHRDAIEKGLMKIDETLGLMPLSV